MAGIRAQMVFKRLARHRWKVVAALVLLVVVATLFCNLLITSSTRGRVYTDASQLPYNDVGLLLGSGSPGHHGYLNLHLKARTEAAAYLYRIGKVKHLLLSCLQKCASGKSQLASGPSLMFLY